METAYVVDIIRTPVAKFGGALAGVRPDDLIADAIRKLLDRNPTFPREVLEEVILGAANQAGEDNRNVARMAALMAGLPVEVCGVTVNRLCASGLQSIIDASRALKLNEGAAYLAGGVESMSRAPYVLSKAEGAWGRNQELFDTTIGWRFTNPRLAKAYHPFTMGETAENVAERWKISREAQDEFAYHSQRKWKEAQQAAKFREEIVAVEVPQAKGAPLLFDTDEHPRFSPLEKLASLQPAFKKGGTVTAGNASGINDGAAAALLVNEATLRQWGLKPMARVVAAAVAGVDPAHMGVGPVPAIQKVLKRAGLRLSDIGLVELNEAFAAQVLACMQDLDLNPEIVNVNGGSIAIGHPLGASGTRISATLLHEMQRRRVRWGLASMCVGVGQGAAVVYELV